MRLNGGLQGLCHGHRDLPEVHVRPQYWANTACSEA